MEFNRLVEQLELNGNRIYSLGKGVSPEQARWRPEPESWSILEVINHLYDEEREDFRVRLNIILHSPEEKWPPIDPQGWVTGRRYNERELDASLQNFLEERRSSLAWLRGLISPDWEASCQAPWGIMKAGDMFTAWVAHDSLHMRQLVELHRAYIVRLSSPYDVRYAGDW
jgi:hypothetical protein